MVSNTEILIASSLVLATTALYIRHKLSPKPIPGIPHRPINSILGDIPEFAHLSKNNIPALLFFERHARELGPIYQFILGPVNVVVLSDLYEIEDLLSRGRSKHLDGSDWNDTVFGGVIPNGQLAMKWKNPLWKKHRRLGGPSMSPKFLKGMTPRIASGAQGLVNYWKDKMTIVRQKGGNCFDALLDLQMGTIDAIAQVAFADHHNGIQDAHDIIHIAEPEINSYGGAKYPSIKGSVLHQAVNHHFHVIDKAFTIPSPLVPTWWRICKLFPTFRRHDKVIRDSIKVRIDQARTRAADANKTGGSEAADCILDMIVEKDVKEGGQQYTEKELMDEMITQLCAGYDTTAAGLAFGIKFLTNNPWVQLKLHEELTSNLSEPENRALTYEEIATGEKTPYLEAVVNEILRCAFVVAWTGRQTQEDVVVLGKVIPKGTDIMFLTGMASMYATKNWAASRDHSDQLKPTKGLWDDEGASDFIPERWLVDGPDGKKVFSSSVGYSIAFGLGPKSCFGQKLAQLEMKIFLATLNLAFYLDKVPQELNSNDIVEVITIKPKECYVNLVDWEDYQRS